MNTSLPVVRLGLLALTGAIILGTTVLHSPPAAIAAPAAASLSLPTVTLETVTVRPADDAVAARAPAAAEVPILPTVFVTASEEEVLAACIDPSDRIEILSTITVQPSADEVAAAMRATAVTQIGEDEHGSIGGAFARAVASPHRLRLDMPYYSFGKALTRSSK